MSVAFAWAGRDASALHGLMFSSVFLLAVALTVNSCARGSEP